LAHLFFSKKPRLSQARALSCPKVFVPLGVQTNDMTKLHFRPYTSKQPVLFPQRIDEDIAEDDPVRIIDAVLDGIDLKRIFELYKPDGRCPYHPRMMLKAIIYGYMNNVYSCRKIEERLKRDIHFIWLAGYEKPDHITINRFRTV